MILSGTRCFQEILKLHSRLLKTKSEVRRVYFISSLVASAEFYSEETVGEISVCAAFAVILQTSNVAEMFTNLLRLQELNEKAIPLTLIQYSGLEDYAQTVSNSFECRKKIWKFENVLLYSIRNRRSPHTNNNNEYSKMKMIGM